MWGLNDASGMMQQLGVAPEFADHNPLPGLTPNSEGFKQSFVIFRSAFPDLEYTIEDMIAVGFDLPGRPHNVDAGIFDGYGRLIGVLPGSGFGARFIGRKSDDLISWTQWANSSGMLEIYSNGKQTLSINEYRMPKVVYNEYD